MPSIFHLNGYSEFTLDNNSSKTLGQNIDKVRDRAFYFKAATRIIG